MDPSRVVVCRATPAAYAEKAPFHPAKRFPEAPFGDVGDLPNPAYDALRSALRIAGLDSERYGTSAWNPLGDWIRPGNTVLLKPNLIKEDHPRDPAGWRYVMTHGSVIRAVADYVAIALQGRGAIWVADAPQTDSSWSRIVDVLQLQRLADYFESRGLTFELVDLRKEEWAHRDGVIMSRRALEGDPRGYVAFDLADTSEFHGHPGAGNYYGADYVTREVNVHHTGGRHEYLISGSAVQADVFINVPKLKTHKKAGITCSLKNLVGINGDKNWLPHHTLGAPSEGGDEVPALTFGRRVERRTVRALRRLARGVPVVGPHVFRAAKRAGRVAFGDTESVVRSGNWYGNDTTWRMCLDLNTILLYGGRDGRLQTSTGQVKRYLSFVDGIIAGEGRGPLNPDPVYAGLVLFGIDPVVVDAACAVFMGFDLDKLPIVREAFRARERPLTSVRQRDITVISDEPAWNTRLELIDPGSLFRFRPHFGWTGHVEAAWRSDDGGAAGTRG